MDFKNMKSTTISLNLLIQHLKNTKSTNQKLELVETTFQEHLENQKTKGPKYVTTTMEL
jgi:hypothetical protein